MGERVHPSVSPVRWRRSILGAALIVSIALPAYVTAEPRPHPSESYRGQLRVETPSMVGFTVDYRKFTDLRRRVTYELMGLPVACSDGTTVIRDLPVPSPAPFINRRTFVDRHNEATREFRTRISFRGRISADGRRAHGHAKIIDTYVNPETADCRGRVGWTARLERRTG